MIDNHISKIESYFRSKKGTMGAQKPRPKRMALTWAVIGVTVLIFVTATILTVLLGNKSKRQVTYSVVVLAS